MVGDIKICLRCVLTHLADWFDDCIYIYIYDILSCLSVTLIGFIQLAE